jgi:flagellar biosynthesis/type III secretory pathway chaperone
MDATLCREHLAEIIREELGLLAQLHGLLEEERQVIASTDLKRLQRCTELRQQRFRALAASDEQRRALCSLHGQSADAAGVERLIKWCDPQGELAPLLRESRERVLRCRELNNRNGVLVAAHLKRVDQRLRALRGRASGAPIYGPRGDLSGNRSGRILGSV